MSAPLLGALSKARHANLSKMLEGKGWSLALTSFILLLAFALRIHLLGDKSVWWDEAISAWTSRNSALDIVLYQAREVHPPFYYLVLHFWGKMAGDSEFALRYVSVAAGVASVALLYRLGRKFLGPFPAVAAALLLAVSRFHVWWSQEIRMYSLAVLLGIASLYFLLSALRDDRRSHWVLYAITSIAALYTLYLNSLAIVAQNVLAVLLILFPLLGRRKTLTWLMKWILIQAIVLTAYSPWLYLMKTHAGQRPSSEVPTLGFALFWQVYASVVSLGIDLNISDYAYLLPLPLLLVALGIVGGLWKRPSRHLGLLLLLYLTIAPALIYALSLPTSVFYTPFVHSRYFLFLSPAFLLALAWGLALLKSRIAIAGPALLALVAGIGLFFTNSYYEQRFREDDYQAIAATIDAYAEPSDAIVLYPDTDWPIFLYHYTGDLPWYPVPYAQNVTADWAAKTLSPLLERHRAVWLVSSVKAMDTDPQRHVLTWLTDRAQPLIDQEYFESRLTLFGSRQAKPERVVRLTKVQPAFPLQETLPDGITLLGYDQWLSRASSGETAHVAIYWQDAGQRQYDYSLALSAGDQPIVSRGLERPQSPTVDQPIREQLSLVIPASTPSGTYHWQLRASDRTTKAVARTIDLGKLEVVQVRPSATAFLPLPQSFDIQHERRIKFGEEAALLGYDLQPGAGEKLAPGDPVHITLYWQRSQQISSSYTVFVHLLGEKPNPRRNNFIWGQKDSLPADGQSPTTTWRENETIVDRYDVPIDQDAPPGRYQVEVGMYQRATGKRLDVSEGGEPPGDRVIIGEMDVP
ncbi:MAG: glycosyltransferase family 39 protein [Chloroflexi bacterium]|nr:glycosyltransferase family 39 protein [Chloroflexota bacterium]